MIDWTNMTAEEVLAAIESRPVVLGPWKRWSFATGWSRSEVGPQQTPGRLVHLAVQPHTGCEGWGLSGFGKYGTCHTVADKDAAMALGDKLALEQGWKLMAAPSEGDPRG